jgi:hypothetical protein
MKTVSVHKIILFGVVIFTVLFFILICSFFAWDWHVGSAKVTSIQLFQNGGDYPWTTMNTLRFEPIGDPLVVHKQFCIQHGWNFYSDGNCQYSHVVDLGPSFYITISKTLTCSRTKPIYMTLGEAYTIHKKEP